MNEELSPSGAATARAALVATAGSILPAGPAGWWKFALPNAALHEVAALVVDDWLMLDTPAVAGEGDGGLEPDHLWRVLTWNAMLPGFAKFALDSEPSLRLRAEIPLAEEIDVARSVQAVCDGFQWGWEQWEGQPHRPPAGERGAPPIDLARLCAEANWPFKERAANRIAVTLETRDGFYQALLSQTGRGLEVGTELASGEALAPPCREAWARVLLTAARFVRLARPIVITETDQTIARWEVVFADPPGAAELSAALSNLCGACDLMGEEIRALQDETMAREYLALRGCASQRE